MQPLPCAQKYR